MRRAAALSLVLLAACGSRTPPSVVGAATDLPEIDQPRSAEARAAPRAAPPESREAKLIARMLERVARARSLAARAPVPGVVLSRPEIIARVREHVAREIPEVAIRNEGLANAMLGFVPAGFDYEEEEFSLLEKQIAGYYEPADKTMYLVSDLPDDEAEATLAHELVHALQDQRWGLEERSKYRPGESDRALATAALAEGDATSAMFDVTLAGSGRTALDVPDRFYEAKIRDNVETGPGAEAPRVMRSSLAAPYLFGLVFVHAMRRRGGWATVDAAWDDPPTTTEQLLHVPKYDAREPPERVEPPAFATLGAGWRVADADTFGELGARLAFEEWMEPDLAAAAASAWGGDRAEVLENGELVAFAWRLRFDAGRLAPDEHAKTSFYRIERGLERTLGKRSTGDGTHAACFERGDRGPLFVARDGRDVVWLAGPARAHEGAWRAEGDCALAARWMREVQAP